MKLSTVLLALPALAAAVPLTTPNMDETTAKLLGRDNNCYLNSDALVNDPQGCDTTPFSVSRVRGVTGASRFGVRCTARGRSFRVRLFFSCRSGLNTSVWGNGCANLRLGLHKVGLRPRLELLDLGWMDAGGM